MFGVVLTKSPKRQNVQSPLLETMQFIPYEYNSDKPVSLERSMRIALEIILQNCTGLLRQLDISVVNDEYSNGELVNLTKEILSGKPFTVTNFIQTDFQNIEEKFDVILLDGTLDNLFFQFLKDDGFIIFRGLCTHTYTNDCPLEIIFSTQIDNSHLFLLRKCPENSHNRLVVNIKHNGFQWLDTLKDHIEKASSNIIYLVSGQDEMNGLTGLINCLNKEGTGCKFRVVITDDELSFGKGIFKNFKKQLKKDLVFNILNEGEWGTYVYLPLEEIGTKLVADATVDIAAIGNLSSLTWKQAPPIYHQ